MKYRYVFKFSVCSFKVIKFLFFPDPPGGRLVRNFEAEKHLDLPAVGSSLLVVVATRPIPFRGMGTWLKNM